MAIALLSRPHCVRLVSVIPAEMRAAGTLADHWFSPKANDSFWQALFRLQQSTNVAKNIPVDSCVFALI